MIGLEGKKLIIYFAANAHGYLTCIVHRLLYNKENFAVYVGDNSTAPRTGGLDLFDDNILYRQIAGDWGNKNDLSPEEYEKYLLNFFDGELKKHKIAIQEVAEWYIGSNWADFPIYLNLKGIKHNIFQEGIGDIGLSKESWAVKFPCQFEARKKTGMFRGLDNDNIIAAYIHPKTYKGEHQKIIPFDIVKEMQKLRQEDKDTLAALFKIPQYVYSPIKKILLLTQWFRINGEVWKSTDILKMYSLLLDLYIANNSAHVQLLIKPHPADPMKTEYKKVFLGCDVLTSSFPSECMGLIEDASFDKAITISSSSIYSAEAISKKQIAVKFFEKFYNSMPSVFMCARLVKLLGYKCFHFGIFNEVMLPLIAERQGYLPDKSIWYRIDTTPLTEKGAVIIYDYIWREGVYHVPLSKLTACPKGSFAFIITENINNHIQTLYDLKLVDYLFTIGGELTPYEDGSSLLPLYTSHEVKKIYVFTKDTEVKEKIQSLSWVYTLPYSRLIAKKIDLKECECADKIKLNYLLDHFVDQEEEK